MSSKDFWEEDPQLYWAYRISYIKKMKLDAEQQDYNCWLQGSYNYKGVSVALNNSFSKQKIEFPSKPLTFKEEKIKTKEQKAIEKIKDKDERNQAEFNLWARL